MNGYLVVGMVEGKIPFTANRPAVVMDIEAGVHFLLLVAMSDDLPAVIEDGHDLVGDACLIKLMIHGNALAVYIKRAANMV